jgi:hypothetical protein
MKQSCCSIINIGFVFLKHDGFRSGNGSKIPASPSRSFFLRTVTAILLLIFTSPSFAQDSSEVIISDSPVKRKVIPHKASMYSAIIPGLGQAYNGKYWKIPIIYGGFAGLGAMVVFYDKNYIRYKTAYQYRTDGNPNTIDEFAGDSRYTPEILTSFKDFHRRNRDQSIIFMFAFYALNIIDATVDAHFLNFDVGEDLSLNIAPEGQPFLTGSSFQNQNYVGLKCSLKF